MTSSLSVFVNAKPVESCFEKRVRLVQFLGELLEFKLNKINRYKLPRLKCTHKQDTEGQIPTVVQRNIPATYPKRSHKTRLVKFRRPTLRKAAITTQKETQHTVKLHGYSKNYSLNIILWHATLSLHQLIQIPSKFKQYLRLFTNRIWHTRSGRPNREFCTDTLRLTIRESRVRDVYAIIDDVTTPYEPLYVIVSVIVGFRNLSIVSSPILRQAII